VGESETENAALERAAKLVLDGARPRPLGAVAPLEPAFEVLRHDLVERCFLGATTLVAAGGTTGPRGATGWPDVEPPGVSAGHPHVLPHVESRRGDIPDEHFRVGGHDEDDGVGGGRRPPPGGRSLRPRPRPGYPLPGVEPRPIHARGFPVFSRSLSSCSFPLK
jgi:hypothetical protein